MKIVFVLASLPLILICELGNGDTSHVCVSSSQMTSICVHHVRLYWTLHHCIQLECQAFKLRKIDCLRKNSVGKLCILFQIFCLVKHDSDNDHSFNQLPAHKALTCPRGQSAGDVATPWLAKGIRSMHK